MPYFSRPFLCVSSVLKPRRALACAMLGFVLEALCVLGRAPGAIELRTPHGRCGVRMLERPKNRTGLGLASRCGIARHDPGYEADRKPEILCKSSPSLVKGRRPAMRLSPKTFLCASVACVCLAGCSEEKTAAPVAAAAGACRRRRAS